MSRPTTEVLRRFLRNHGALRCLKAVHINSVVVRLRCGPISFPLNAVPDRLIRSSGIAE
jgi:hypothetical protein